MALPDVWRVATRRSRLARSQAQQVADALAAATGRPAELFAVSTSGDEHPERAVEAFDAKGLFVDGVRRAVLAGDAHVAVHSYKDLPSEAAPGLVIAAVPRRLDPRDVIVTVEGHRLSTLPRMARIGTSSARRRAQIGHARRDLHVQPLRGNVDTRLQRVHDASLDAIVVAMAGLARLGPTELPLKAVALEHGECLHAPGQGALALECREDDAATRMALATLDDAQTRTLVAAERSLLANLDGGCTAPIGAHAELLADGTLELLGMLADASGGRLLRGSERGPATEPERVGAVLAGKLVEQGGGDVLRRLRDRAARDAPADAGQLDH